MNLYNVIIFSRVDDSFLRVETMLSLKDLTELKKEPYLGLDLRREYVYNVEQIKNIVNGGNFEEEYTHFGHILAIIKRILTFSTL